MNFKDISPRVLYEVSTSIQSTINQLEFEQSYYSLENDRSFINSVISNRLNLLYLALDIIDKDLSSELQP